jgi:hypothetical protein
MLVVEHGHGAGDLLGHSGEDGKVAISESVMQQSAVLLRKSGWVADNVNDGYVFGIRSSNGVDCRELAHTKGGNEGGYALYSSVTVCCVAWIELEDLS